MRKQSFSNPSQVDLKIAVDARCLANPISGIERYTLNLLRGIAAVEPAYRIVAVVENKTKLPADLQKSPSLELMEVRAKRRSLADQLILPALIGRLGLRVFHSPDSFGPLLAPCRGVITIHDIIGITCRKLLTGSVKSQWPSVWKAWLKVQCGKAKAVVTVSEYSAKDIVKILGAGRQKIHVIANAVPQLNPGQESGPNDFLSKQSICGRIVLYVGRADPYKNLVRLIRAFDIVRKRCPEPIHLAMAGKKDSRYRQAQELSCRLGLDDSVHFLGYLNEAELIGCYEAASVFVLASLYEGSGLPALEAMSFGVPVVCSNRTALPEVLGEVALYVEPEDPQAIAQGILRVLGDPELARQLGAAGKVRAQTFSVQDVGRRHLELYESLLA